MSNNKYLDIQGVQALWTAVKNEDAKIQSSIASAKGSYIVYQNGEVQLWADEATANTEGAKPLSSFPAGDFIKDGMLESVETVFATASAPIVYKDEEYRANQTFIKFTFNEAAGDADSSTDGIQKKVLYVKADEIGKIYEAGDGINIADGTNKISVSEVHTEQTYTTAEITVEGGPLADLLKGAGIDKIAAGTTVQGLFETLFSKEYYPGDGQKGNPATAMPTYTEGTVTASYGALSASLYKSGTTNASTSEVEVGTKVDLSSVIGSSLTSTNIARTYSGFYWGYATKNAETGVMELNKDKTPDSQDMINVSPIAATESTQYSLKREFTGNWLNEGLTTSTSKSIEAPAKCEIAKYNGLIVGDGDNKVKFTMSGPGVEYDQPNSVDYYHLSNVYKTNDSKKLNAITGINQSVNASNGTKTLTITGKRYVFWGAYAEPQPINSDTIRGLGGLNTGEGAINANVQNKAFGATGTKTINMTTSGVKQFIVAIPQANGKKLTSAKNETAMGNEELAFFTNNKTTVNVKGANDYAAVKYDVYVYTSGTAWSGDGKAYTINIG